MVSKTGVIEMLYFKFTFASVVAFCTFCLCLLHLYRYWKRQEIVLQRWMFHPNTLSCRMEHAAIFNIVQYFFWNGLLCPHSVPFFEMSGPSTFSPPDWFNYCLVCRSSKWIDLYCTQVCFGFLLCFVLFEMAGYKWFVCLHSWRQRKESAV